MTIRVKVKAKRKSKEDRHYIDNKEFHKALSAYKLLLDEAKLNNDPKPIVPDYIAHSILMLARKVARKHFFCNYPFVEDMIGDAILCCFKNLHNFDPSKPSAFPYFTQIVYNAFFQKIEKEKKDLYRKFMAIMDRQKELTGVTGFDGVQLYGTKYTDLQMREFCEAFEERLEKKREKSRNRKRSLKASFQFDDE